MNSAIILAAGKSSRMKKDIPKPYLKINGKLVIDYSITTLENSNYIDNIILVVSKEYISEMKDNYPHIKVIEGGNSRRESSSLGLKSCNANTKNVLIHDAARIFITETLIQQCIEGLKNADGITAAALITDTIAQYKNNSIVNMQNREELILFQTPQAFNYKKILIAHKKFRGDATDDISIMMMSNYNCKFILSDKQNFKLTTQIDYDNAIKILQDN